jgi:hypothetical protein
LSESGEDRRKGILLQRDVKNGAILWILSFRLDRDSFLRFEEILKGGE